MVKYKMTFTSNDLGTENLVQVFDLGGKLIGQRDPFFKGIPSDKTNRQNAIKRAAIEIVKEHKRGK